MMMAGFLVALAGCGGDSSGPSKIEAEGSWSGPVKDNSGTAIATMTLTLTETTGTVAGSGNLSGNGVAEAVTVTGTYAEPHLSLALSAQGFSDINLTATVAATQMTGTLNGSGFVSSAITLTRQ